MQQISFPIQQEYTFDVVVAGGGSTGLAAAIASARSGAKTAIIESNGFLGGNSVHIAGWMGFRNKQNQQVIGGIAYEMIEKLREINGATEIYQDPICSSIVGVDVNLWKLLAMRETLDAEVTVMLHSLVVGAEFDESDDKTITHVDVISKQGLSRIKAEMFIDCTDSGDLANFAGVKLLRGRPKDHAVQVSSWAVFYANIDFEKLFAYFENHPQDIRPFKEIDGPALLQKMKQQEVFVMGSFRSLIARAKADGMPLNRDIVPGIAFPLRGEIMSVASRVVDVNPNDTENYSHSEAQGMEQALIWLDFFRKYVPGFEQARLSFTPAMIGIRETNHIEGEYVLAGEDLVTGRQFKDVIALGDYHLDIHSPDHQGVDTTKPNTYQIPYRCLLPREVNNLFVAARAISASHEAYSAIRVIPISMAAGEAAGTAAALAVYTHQSPKQIDVTELQKILVQNNAILSVYK